MGAMQLREQTRPAIQITAEAPAVAASGAWSSRRKLIVIVAAAMLAWVVWGGIGYLLIRLIV